MHAPITSGHPRVPYTTSICTPGIGTGEAGTYTACGCLGHPWGVTALVVAHAPISSRGLDIPSPLSPSSIWVSVSVSVRRCYRFSRLYAHMHFVRRIVGVAVGMPQRRIAVLMAYNATASSTLDLLKCSGHWAHHIRSKSTSENDTAWWGQNKVRRGVEPRLRVLMVRLLAERGHRALSRWKCYTLCSQSLSLCFWCQRQPQHFALLTRQYLSIYYFGITEIRVLRKRLVSFPFLSLEWGSFLNPKLEYKSKFGVDTEINLRDPEAFDKWYLAFM